MSEPYEDLLQAKYKRKRSPVDRWIYGIVGLMVGVIATAALILGMTARQTTAATDTPFPQPTQFELSSPIAQAIEPTIIAKRIEAIDLSADGLGLAIAYSDGMSHVQLQALGITSSLLSISSVRPIQDSKQHLSDIALSPDQRYLFTVAVIDGSGYLFDTLSGNSIASYVNTTSGAFSPDGQYLALGGVGGNIRIIDLATQTDTSLITIPNQVIGVAFNADGTLLAAAYIRDASIVVGVWNLAQAQAKPYEYVAGAWVYDLGFSPENYVTVATDNTLLIINPQDASTRFYPLDNFGRVRAIAWSPDGQWFSAVGGDIETGFAPMVTVWRWDTSGILNPDPNAYQPIQLSGHAHNVSSVIFTPDSQYLISGGYDGTLRMWRTDTWELVSELRL